MAADFHRTSSSTIITTAYLVVVLCLSGCSTVHEELSWRSQTHEEVVHGQQVGKCEYSLTGNPLSGPDNGYMRILGKSRFKEIKQKVKTYTYTPPFKEDSLIGLAAGLVTLPFVLTEIVVSAVPLVPDIYGKDEELTAGVKEKYRDKEEVVATEETGEIVTQNISLVGVEVTIALPSLGYEKITHLGSSGEFYLDPQVLCCDNSAGEVNITLSGLPEKKSWIKKISLLMKDAGDFRLSEVCHTVVEGVIADQVETSIKSCFSTLHAGGHGEIEMSLADKRPFSMAEEKYRVSLAGNIMLKNDSCSYNVGNFDAGTVCPGDKVTIKCPVRIPALTSAGAYTFVIGYGQGDKQKMHDVDDPDNHQVRITPLSVKLAQEYYAKGELLPEEIESLSKVGKLSKPEVVPVSISVDDRKERCRGNGDGQLQPGETVVVTMTFLNQSAIPSGKTELLLLVNESGSRQKGIYFNPIRMSVGTFQAGEANEVDFLMTVAGKTDIASVVIPFILRDALFGELVNNFTNISVMAF